MILAPPGPELPEEFDLCLIDGVNLERCRAQVLALRQRAEPALLPFVLMSPRSDRARAFRHLWPAVDEVIVVPVEKVELQARLDSLLKARHLSLEFNRAIVHAAPLALVAVDEHQRVTQWNPAAEQLFGWLRSDVVSAPPPLRPAQGDDVVAQAIAQALTGRAEAGFETCLLRQDGSTVEVLMATAPILGAYGRVGSAVSMFVDVGPRKSAELALQERTHQYMAALTGTVEIVMRIGAMRDPYTAGHERRVALLAVAIGTALGLNEHRLEGLQIAGNLHDIGKITVPTEVLVKPGRLTRLEHQLVQGHVQASHDILQSVDFPWPIAQMVLQHHERMDGSGYPQGLRGDAILLDARILTVADVVEAMSSHRPYRAGLGIAPALAEIERGSGSAYDADVAAACLRLFREQGYTLPP